MPIRRPSVLLVNYAGYTTTSNTFVADSSLATLAGSLVARGIETRILDFQNAQDIGSVGDRAGSSLAERVLDTLGREQRVSPALYLAYRSRRDAAQGDVEALFAERLSGAISEQRPTVVGFKLWAGNGLGAAIAMAETVRRAHPGITIVAGGPAVTLASGRIRARTRAFDHLVVGDGEHAIIQIASGANPGEIVRLGQKQRRGGGVSFVTPLDDLPAAVYGSDVYPGLDRFFPIRVIDESRGCFNRCSFCAHPSINGVTRLRSAGAVVDQIERAVAQDGIRTFRLSGSNPPWKHLCAIAAELSRRRLRVELSAFSSMNNVRAEDLERLAEAGLRALFFGIESGDPEILRRAHGKNNVSNAHVVNVVCRAADAGIFCCLSAIVPSPFETQASRKQTLDLLCTALGERKLGSALILPPFLTPDTQWWAEPERYGFALDPAATPDAIVDSLLDWDCDFMLPRDLWRPLGFTLDGKTSPAIHEECETFVRELQRAGVQTHVDDASFMIGAAAGMTAEAYQRSMLEGLVLGGSNRLLGIVRRARGAAACA
jgi:radical SAM superfamily enzyme YgiQ (UPF0313 family)